MNRRKRIGSGAGGMSASGKRGRRLAATAVALALLVGGGCDLQAGGDDGSPDPSGQGNAVVETVATDLQVPWEIRFLPDGDLLVTERPGRLVRLDPDTGQRSAVTVPDVIATGEAGLMGLALHPEFPETGWVYLCHTTDAGGSLNNRVIRYRYRDHAIEDGQVILGEMPAAAIHDGCRIEFGPDGLLYVTMGDAGEDDRAQDRASLSGKIHCVSPDGSVPDGNPFGTTVFSTGHRNPQGLAWDGEGRLWATEHGPSGFASGRDELNLVRSGENYGWPEIRGDQEREGMLRPVVHSGGDTWAPAGLAHLDGRLFWAGLRGSALYSARLPADGSDPGPGGLELRTHLEDVYGRLRAVRVGPDGMLYVSTSNRDGRGSPAPEDDRILQVDPGSL